MRWLPLTALLFTANAWALTAPTSGIVLDLTGGPGVAGAPAGLAGSWQTSAGIWAGKYDKDFAVGRGWSVSTTYRQTFGRGGLSHTPMIDVRRRLDLLVLTPQLGVKVGPTFVAGATGLTAEIGAGANWRLHRFYGLAAMVEGGATVIGGRPYASVALRLGFSWARPFAQMEPL